MRTRPDLAAGVAALGKLPREDLVSHWVRIYRHQPPAGIRRELLLRAAAWHLQAKHPGGHSAGMRRLLRSAMDRVEAKALALGKERSRTGSEHKAGLSASIDVVEGPVAEAPRCSDCDDPTSQPGSPDRAMEKKAGHRRRQRRSVQPGARLLRDWNGRTHVVDVIEGGYVFEAKVYPSLSAIARQITGAHWSGPRFFGPVIQRCLADTMLAGQIARLRARLVLTQNPDDLLFRKPLPLHLSVLQIEAGL